MKKFVPVISVIICLTVNTMMGQNVGSDKDEHGCRASAGYTFSVIKNECIRVFEQKIKLDEVNPGESSSIAAVIFSDDETKAEVFIPGEKAGIVLLREGQDGDYKWKKGKFSVAQKGTGFVLKKRRKIIFSSAVK